MFRGVTVPLPLIQLTTGMCVGPPGPLHVALGVRAGEQVKVLSR